LAGRACGVGDNFSDDAGAPGAGEVEYALVTGVVGGVEGDLGTRSNGTPRPNDNPCP